MVRNFPLLNQYYKKKKKKKKKKKRPKIQFNINHASHLSHIELNGVDFLIKIITNMKGICVNSKLGAASEMLSSTYKIDRLKSKKFFQAIKTG